MRSSSMKFEGDLYHKLKWLMFFRILFALLLLSSTIIVQFNEKSYPSAKSFTVLYSLAVFIFLLSICYALIYRTQKIKFLFIFIPVGHHLLQHDHIQKGKHDHGRSLQHPVRYFG